MLVQQREPRQLDQVMECLAAVLHNFPEAVIQDREIGQNLNPSFAAHALDVSHADKAAVPLASAEVYSRPIFALQAPAWTHGSTAHTF